MAHRPPEGFAFGDLVIIPKRVAAVIAPLITNELRNTTDDPEVYNCLVAIRMVGLAAGTLGNTGRESSSGFSSALGRRAEPAGELLMGAADAALRTGLTARAIRKAATENRIPAKLIDGQWFMKPEDVEQFRADRAA